MKNFVAGDLAFRQIKESADKCCRDFAEDYGTILSVQGKDLLVTEIRLVESQSMAFSYLPESSQTPELLILAFGQPFRAAVTRGHRTVFRRLPC